MDEGGGGGEVGNVDGFRGVEVVWEAIAVEGDPGGGDPGWVAGG